MNSYLQVINKGNLFLFSLYKVFISMQRRLKRLLTPSFDSRRIPQAGSTKSAGQGNEYIQNRKRFTVITVYS